MASACFFFVPSDTYILWWCWGGYQLGETPDSVLPHRRHIQVTSCSDRLTSEPKEGWTRRKQQQFSQFLTVKLCQVSRPSRSLNPAHAYTAHLRLSRGLSPTPPCPVCWLRSLFFFQSCIFKIVVQLLYYLILDSVLTAAGEPHEGEARLQMSALIKLMVHGLKNGKFIRALDIATHSGK